MTAPSRLLRPAGAALALLLACAAADEEPSARAAAAGAEAPPPPPKASPGAEALAFATDAYLRQEARLRRGGSETDLDLYTDLDATATRRGKVTLACRVNGRLVADVAGDQQPGDLLRDVWDGFEHDAQFRLYEAYAEARGLLGGVVGVRGGRQFLEEGVYLQFDGARVDGDLRALAKGLDASALFGAPVRFHEASRGGDWLAGFVARWRASDATRLRFEYYRVSEFAEGFNDPVTDPQNEPVSFPSRRLDDDLFGLSAWHRARKTLHLFGRLTLLEGDANELHLRARYASEDGRWVAVVEWYQLFGRLFDVTNELTPFSPALGAYEPFWRAGANVTRRFGETWIAQAGYSHRELADSGEEGPFNHAFERLFLSATRTGLFDGTLDLTATGVGFASPRNDVVAAGGAADWRFRANWTLSASVDYALYKYDFLLDTEHEDVWTYSLRLRWKASRRVLARAELSFDNDRFHTYATLLLSVGVRF